MTDEASRDQTETHTLRLDEVTVAVILAAYSLGYENGETGCTPLDPTGIILQSIKLTERLGPGDA